MSKVSVIVPVYNAQKTLTACISNLVHQTLSDIELIFVNDASTDNSLEILMECERMFSDKVILVNLSENSGPGGARNAGLQYASGDYIGFVDSDDMVDVSMFEKLLAMASETGADMVDAAYYDEADDTCILQTPDELCGNLDNAKRSELIAGGGYLWSRLFRRELFDGISFRTHTILEDMEVMMELFMRCRKLANTHDVLYKYGKNPDSASKPRDVFIYHGFVKDAMIAVAECMKRHCIKADNDLRLAFEYSIAHLYEGGLSNLVNAEKLQQERKEAMMAELCDLRKKYILTSWEDNRFVRDKIAENVLSIFKEVDRHFAGR